MIKAVKDDNDIRKCVDTIKDSFITVANEFKLTPQNAPTNPAFITYEKLKQSIDKGTVLYGLSENDAIVGCVAVEKSREEAKYYIERLSVLPDWRHKGNGRNLLDFAFEKIREMGGKNVSIAIIDENKVLKNWYFNYGFKEIGVKKFDHLPFTVCFMEKLI